jgi:peptidoglycan/xylan/chitin deacetylase (PgdA/CDA1 family)
MPETTPSALWRAPLPPDLDARLTRWLTDGLAAAKASRRVTVFCRADDVGVPSRRFERLVELFQRHRAPLGLAVVPAWLTPARWERLAALTGGGNGLWCWHQHGWRHVNHEPAGKKQEFGPARPRSQLAADLRRGRERVEALMGPAFYPAFTPPWNRCSAESLELIREAGYRAVSRSSGSRPQAPPGLPELAVNLDLHTRREPTAERAWQGLAEELQAAVATGHCGIMIHHQRMNAAAAAFLDALLAALKAHRGFQLTGMPALAENGRRTADGRTG